MRHEMFWFVIFMVFLGLYFNTEATKEFVQGFLLRSADILTIAAGK